MFEKLVLGRSISLYTKKKQIENNTWARVDMEFICECSTRLLTSERSERVRCQDEHDKSNSISTSNHALFCLSYKHNSP